jgi:hypothetical protein
VVKDRDPEGGVGEWCDGLAGGGPGVGGDRGGIREKGQGMTREGRHTVGLSCIGGLRPTSLARVGLRPQTPRGMLYYDMLAM